MIRTKTVLVVGAGASAELQMPTGDALKTEIAKALNFGSNGLTMINGDGDVMQAMNSLADTIGKNQNEMISAAHQIVQGMPQARSIDEFIHYHNDDPAIALCGKLAIVKCIANAEKKALQLMASRPGAWYDELFRLLIQEHTKADIETIFDNLTIVCFNYDRCIEHFLFEALRVHNGDQVNHTAIVNAMRRLKIHHPYGTIGSLHWQNAGGPRLDFGNPIGAGHLTVAYSGIRTFTEELEDTEARRETLEEWQKAEHVFFLGFGYGDLNLNLFEKIDHGVAFVGTAYQMSDHNQADLLKELQIRFFPDFLNRQLLVDMTCREMLIAHSRLVTRRP